MGRKQGLLLSLLLLCGGVLHAQRICNAYTKLQQQLQQNPGMQQQRNHIEQFTQQFVAGGCDARKTIVHIPVVFHVLYNNASQNISNARLLEQLDVLNRDFSRTNADAGNTPSAFSGVAWDTEIQFCLATRTPQNTPTTGIIRKSTSKTSFSYTADDVKFNGTGGDDAWPTSDYLNIWVCNLSGGTLGYAQFPGGPANTDGIVLLYSTVGGPNVPGTAAPYHLGRTASHEVGHWLNLNHIWGDDGSACSGTDNVGDTPNQTGANFGCPGFPRTDACTGSSPGVMFMNYMDYTDDGCMNMFTQGQSLRMHACLESWRASLHNSLGCIPVASGTDLYMRDSHTDLGNEPNTLTGPVIWDSPDIWIRRNNDNVPTHQNPLNSVTNYVYVRVLNKGTSPSTGTEELNVYWTKAGVIGNWPGAWDGSQNYPCGVNPLRGNKINPTPITIPVIPAGGSTIIAMPWIPPNPAHYLCISPTPEEWHFCLAARIETNPAPPYGMTFPEGSDIGTNTRQNKKIAWKNCHIDPPTLVTEVGSNASVPTAFNLIYAVPENELNDPITSNGDITIELGPLLFEKWTAMGQQGRGVVVDESRPFTIRITDAYASIDNFVLTPDEYATPTFRINFSANHNSVKCIYMYNVMLQNHATQDIVGGVLYEVHKPVCDDADAGQDVMGCPGCAVQLSAGGGSDVNRYEWTDLGTGEIVSTEAVAVVSPSETTIYELKVFYTNGCIDNDFVTVFMQGAGKIATAPPKERTLEAIPNPFGSTTRIRFSLPETCPAKLLIFDELGREVASLFDGTAQADKVYDIDFQPKDLPKGVYFARLNGCGDQTSFVKLLYLD